MQASEEIYVLNKQVKLLHPAQGFRAGLDSVMLAAACPAKEDENILDLGCGVGGAGLCVLARVADTILTGIDIQEDHIDLAKENAAENNMAARSSFLLSDIQNYKDERFDHVICNPPYQDSDERVSSPSSGKETAHAHQEDMSLWDWIDCAVRNLKSKGSLTMIHRADMTDKIIGCLEGRFGGTEIIPLWPKKKCARQTHNYPHLSRQPLPRRYSSRHRPAQGKRRLHGCGGRHFAPDFTYFVMKYRDFNKEKINEL